MVEFVLFCIPTVIYVLVKSRGPDRNIRTALGLAGATLGPGWAYILAFALLAPLVLIGWFSVTLIPHTALTAPGVSIAHITSVGSGVSVVLGALGEEIFFRGLLAGVLVRRLGLKWGNLLQAILFLLPHLPLLAIDVRTWPILPVQFGTGWLRTTSGTFLPGAAIHVIINIVSGLFAG